VGAKKFSKVGQKHFSMIYQHQLNGCSPKQERCCNWWASPHWSPKTYNLVFWLLSVNIKLFHETTVITDFLLVTSLLNAPMPPSPGYMVFQLTYATISWIILQWKVTYPNLDIWTHELA